MPNPVRALYANSEISQDFTSIVGSTTLLPVANGNVYTAGDVVFYHGETSPVEGLANNKTYYVVSTTSTGVRLAETLATSGEANTTHYVNITGPSGSGLHSLDIVRISGVKEMTDDEVIEAYAPAMSAVLLSDTSDELYQTTNQNLAFAPSHISLSNTLWYGIGSWVDNTKTSAVGAHPYDPTTQDTSTTVLVYQGNIQRPTQALQTGLTPLMVVNGDETQLKEFTLAEFQEYVVKPVKSAVLQGLGGSYLIDSSTPTAPGTWVYKYQVFTDRYYNGSTLVTRPYYLYRRHDAYHDPRRPKPLFTVTTYATASRTNLREMSDAAMQEALRRAYSYPLSKPSDGDIGTYHFGIGTPAPGTWVTLSTITQYENQHAVVDYVGNYSRSYTSTYSGEYTSAFTGEYTRQQFANYAGTYSRDYTHITYTGFTRTYQSTYTHTELYSGSYTGLYTHTYLGTYNTYYSRAGFANFNRLYTGSYTAVYVPAGLSGGGNYTRGYNTGYTRTYSRFVGYNTTYTRTYNNTFSRTYSRAWAGNYVRNYTAPATFFYNSPNYTGGYTRDFTGVYTTYINYTGDYTRDYNDTYSRAFSGTYTSDYTGTYQSTYTSIFTAIYGGTYSRAYSVVWSRTYAGTYSGITVLEAKDTTTYSFMVRIS